MKYILLSIILLSISCATENEKIVWEFLKEKGLTDAGAAGLMGNLQAESNIQSVIYENAFKPQIGLTDQEYVDKVNDGSYINFVNDQVGFGLAQWTYFSRKQALLDACRGDIGNLRCQLGYLMYEFDNDFKQILAVLKTSNDVYACAIKVMVEFENPVDQSEAKKNFRYQLSQNYYNEFTGTGPAGNTYTVVAGDTLAAIAAKFGVTVEALCELNDISNPNMIYVGQILRIP